MSAVMAPERTRMSDKQAALVERIAGQRRSCIQDVHAQLLALQPALDEWGTPGRHFNELYTEITARVGGYADEGRYQNPEFLHLLDVEFANRYFAALSGIAREDGSALGSWMMLFEPETPDDAPIQYAALGVNAHVNADLTFALLNTFTELGIAPRDGSPEHHDYLLVNDIFHERIPGLRQAFLGFPLPDDLLDRTENWFAGLLVNQTRDQAWDAAVHFWPRRDEPDYLARKEAQLDWVACMVGDFIGSRVGRGLLYC